MTRVFISYSRRDAAEFVDRLARDLVTHGVEVFYDQALKPGDSWAEVLSSAIEQSDFLLVVLTPAALESLWVEQEWSAALYVEVAAGRTKVIPIKYLDCEPPPLLANKFWADFRENYEKGLRQLLQALQGRQEVAPLTAETSPEEVRKFTDEMRQKVEAFRNLSSATPAPAPTKSGPKRCFMVMPFGREDLNVVYEYFLKPVAEEECGLVTERGDDIFGSNPIMDDILGSIERADIVIADLTGKNANVFYEVGICHARNKQVLLLAQSIDDVPFDLRHRRVQIYEYSPRGCKILEGKLKAHLDAMTGKSAVATA